MESIILYVWQDVSGRIYKIILSGLPAVGDGLFHSWSGRSRAAFRFRLKWTAKKKNRQKSVKALLWHTIYVFIDWLYKSYEKSVIYWK